MGDEGSRSYHLFFIASEDERTKYETEIDQLDEEGVAQTISGSGIMGCAVGISMLAPFAMIVFDGLEELNDGSYSNPDIEAHIISGVVDEPFPTDESREAFCKMPVGEQGLSVLAGVRGRIARILRSPLYRGAQRGCTAPTGSLAARRRRCFGGEKRRTYHGQDGPGFSWLVTQATD